MSAKVISKSSDKAVLRQRVKFSEIDGEPVFMTGLISGFLSIFAVSMPMNVAGHVDIFLSLLTGAGLAGGLTGAVFAGMYANEVANEAERYSTKDMSTWKALSGVLFPFGQKPVISSSKAKLYKTMEQLNSLEYKPSTTSSEATHDVISRVKYTPLGAYIEQEFIVSPMNVWDDAFKSTVDVHNFRESKKVSGK